MLIFSLIVFFVVLFGGNCTHNLIVKIVKPQKRAARVILDCDCYTPLCMMFAELKWMTFPERVLYQKAIQMFEMFEEMHLNT